MVKLLRNMQGQAFVGSIKQGRGKTSQSTMRLFSDFLLNSFWGFTAITSLVLIIPQEMTKVETLIILSTNAK